MSILHHLKTIHFVESLVFASMKNSSLAFDKGKARKNEKGYKCSLCEMVFKSYQARGRHQRVHQDEIEQLIDQKHVIPSNISINVTRSNAEHENIQRTLSEGTIKNSYVSKGKAIVH